MDNLIEIKATSVEEAIKEGLEKLGLEREEADVEVLSKGGFLRKASIRIKRKEEQKGCERSEKGETFIREILRLLRLDCDVEKKEEGEKLYFYIKGEKVNRIIGHRGEVLDALQILVSNVVNKNDIKYTRITVDADFYRKKREKSLINLAHRLARKIERTKRAEELEPMNAFERRIIHMALHENGAVKTESIGKGRSRRIVILPQEEEKQDIEYGTTSFKQKGPQIRRSFGYKRKRF